MKKIKQYLKKQRNTGLTPEIDELIEIIKTKEVVSFDIFDTLLKRNVNDPSDVFDIVQKKLGDTVNNFTKNRILAEKQARTKKNSEITIRDIYEEYANIENIDIERCIQVELETENEILVKNDRIYDVYKKCLKLGKKVYIISDMYMPSDFLANVLKKNGINQYVKLYVSCEVGKTKAEGNLFDLVLAENMIDAKCMVHIGDSWNSDYKSAKKRDILPIHIPLIDKRDEITFDLNKIETNYLNSFIKNKVVKKEKYYKFGYGSFGPFLWGYVRWIYNEVTKNGINKVYFFSRDGYIMKQAFDLIYKDKNIDTHYLEVSRRSLRVPVLWQDYSFETLLNMISPSKRIAIRTIFDGVGLDIQNYADQVKRAGFNMNTQFDRNSILEDKKLKELYDSLSSDIIEKSKEEYENLNKYLSQERLEGKFAIIDIGWSGGMQRYLEQTLDSLNISYDITGYYIGVADYYKRNIAKHELKMNGYLFDFMNDSMAIDKRSSFVGLFETLFLEQNGSVINYSEKNGVIASNRAPYEYIVDGKEMPEVRKVHEIQSGALDFIKDTMNDTLFYKDYFEFTADDLFQGIAKTGKTPTKKDLELFADFGFYDEGEDEKLANPKSIFKYMLNPKTFKNDFLKSRWKIGFMKRLFKINLPYENIYQYLLKFK